MITPSNISFTFKKFGTAPPGVLLYHTESFSQPPIALLSGIPNWLEIYDITTTNLKIRVRADIANNLAVGLHTETATITLQDTNTQQQIVIGSVTVNLTVEDTVVLNVTPTNLNFEYEDGGNPPISKTVVVSAEAAYTITKSEAWINLSTTTGTGSGNFQVSVNISGLTPNLYTGTVTVDDGTTTKIINVSLTIGQPNTPTDYLFVTPSSLNFGFTVGGNVPSLKAAEVNSSDAFTITASQAWIDLPTTSAAAGVHNIQIGIKAGTDLNNLPVGNHLANVTFTKGTFIRIVQVNLEVYQFTTVLPSNTELLFTDDDNLLQFATPNTNTYMQIDYTALYKSVAYLFTVKLPVFKGGATRSIGIIPKKIIGKQDLIGLADFAVFQPYNPLLLNLTIKEVELFTDVISSTTYLNNLTFIKGNKPTNKWLSNVSKKIALTNKATLCFSVFSNKTITNYINISGDITRQINVQQFIDDTKYFYTVVLPISYLGEFEEGTEFTIEFFNETIDVVIRDEETDHTMVYWENEYGCIDSCELVGEVTITPSIKRNTATFRKNSTTLETKILDVKKPLEYKVNTGFINSEEEFEMIKKMLESKKVWLQTQNKIIPVVPETSNVPYFKSLREIEDFDIIFNHIEE